MAEDAGSRRQSVLLSYSRKDKPKVDLIAAELERDRITTWRDTTHIPGGDAWRTAIVQGLDECDAVVLFLSPNSMESDNVRREVTMAEEQHKALIPVVLETTQISSGFRYSLAGLQHIDMTGDAYVSGLNQLRGIVGADPRSRVASIPAPVPQRSQRGLALGAAVGAVLLAVGAIVVLANSNKKSAIGLTTQPTVLAVGVTAATTSMPPPSSNPVQPKLSPPESSTIATSISTTVASLAPTTNPPTSTTVRVSVAVRIAQAYAAVFGTHEWAVGRVMNPRLPSDTELDKGYQYLTDQKVISSRIASADNRTTELWVFVRGYESVPSGDRTSFHCFHWTIDTIDGLVTNHFADGLSPLAEPLPGFLTDEQISIDIAEQCWSWMGQH
jgi:TIR domain